MTSLLNLKGFTIERFNGRSCPRDSLPQMYKMPVVLKKKPKKDSFLLF